MNYGRNLPALLLSLALVIFMVFNLPASAAGQRSYSVENKTYTATLPHPRVPKSIYNNSYSSIEWDAELKMGLLYNEPVFSTKFRYYLKSWKYFLPSLGPKK